MYWLNRKKIGRYAVKKIYSQSARHRPLQNIGLWFLETLEMNMRTKLEKSRLHLKSFTTYCNFSSISGMRIILKMFLMGRHVLWFVTLIWQVVPMLRSAFIVRNRQSKGILLVCLILKVESSQLIQTWGTTRPQTQRHITDDLNLQQHCCENLKTRAHKWVTFSLTASASKDNGPR